MCSNWTLKTQTQAKNWNCIYFSIFLCCSFLGITKVAFAAKRKTGSLLDVALNLDAGPTEASEDLAMVSFLCYRNELCEVERKTEAACCQAISSTVRSK